ncbi:hypothetical protein BASA81_013841 [Batrachochytrium salamandrivorans]|nr:hypothetical protein BASA81_013841 [Batrachochytrium salamandrivorans]
MAPVVEEVPAEVLAARAKLREKMGAGAQTGGKGSVRRKVKPIPKSSHTDDKKVAEVSKKAGLQDIQGVEEANIIFTNGEVVSFAQPKVRGMIQANTMVIHGPVANTHITKIAPEMRGDLAPGNAGMPQLTPDMMKQIQQIMAANGLTEADLQDPSKQEQVAKAFASFGGAEEAGADGEVEEDDDEMPTLSGKQTFEDISADAD